MGTAPEVGLGNFIENSVVLAWSSKRMLSVETLQQLNCHALSLENLCWRQIS